MSWYSPSLTVADTHRGDYSTVTRGVHALCGVEFVARALPLGGPAPSGSPLDPDQICPDCRRIKTIR